MCGGRARAARLCARVFAHVVGARMADAVSARWMRHAAGWEVAAWTPALPRAAEQLQMNGVSCVHVSIV